MKQTEKIERLRDRAKVSEQDAREALERSEWDLLDAMLLLEQMGKTEAPGMERYTTSYEQQPQYLSVQETVKQKQAYDKESILKKIWKLCLSLWEKGQEYEVWISRKGKQIVSIPLWICVVLFLITWQAMVAIVVLGLLFEFRFGLCKREE